MMYTEEQLRERDENNEVYWGSRTPQNGYQTFLYDAGRQLRGEDEYSNQSRSKPKKRYRKVIVKVKEELESPYTTAYYDPVIYETKEKDIRYFRNNVLKRKKCEDSFVKFVRNNKGTAVICLFLILCVIVAIAITYKDAQFFN